MADDIHLEEYKSLRDEVFKKVAAAETLEFYAAGAVAAVYAWLAGNKVPGTAWLWHVPVVFPVLGALRAWTLDRQLGVISEYLARLEQELSPKKGGWEAFKTSRIGRFKDWAARVFWPALLIAALVIPIWYREFTEERERELRKKQKPESISVKMLCEPSGS